MRWSKFTKVISLIQSIQNDASHSEIVISTRFFYKKVFYKKVVLDCSKS